MIEKNGSSGNSYLCEYLNICEIEVSRHDNLLRLIAEFFRGTPSVFLERLRKLAGVCIAYAARDFGDIKFSILQELGSCFHAIRFEVRINGITIRELEIFLHLRRAHVNLLGKFF